MSNLKSVSVEVSAEVHLAAERLGGLVRDFKKAADDGLDLNDVGPLSASVMAYGVPFVKDLSATVAAAKAAPLESVMGFCVEAYQVAKELSAEAAAPAEETAPAPAE